MLFIISKIEAVNYKLVASELLIHFILIPLFNLNATTIRSALFQTIVYVAFFHIICSLHFIWGGSRQSKQAIINAIFKL